MDESITEVSAFKAKAKEFIQASKYKEAIEFAKRKINEECFQDLELREEVTFVHWWTKIYYKACDLRNLTANEMCLTRVNTMINTIVTSTEQPNFKKADGQTPMTAKEIDQCLAELCYLKRSIDTVI